MSQFFQFEADFVESLRCIPLQVRLKLDTCGVKLKLTHWHQFTTEERQKFVDLPCQTPEEVALYQQQLQSLVEQYTGSPASELEIDPHPPWLEEQKIPDTVQEKAREFSLNLTPEQWSNLSPDQRFALIKLSRPSHENKNFVPALKEFGLWPLTENQDGV